jgi:hypothetical protein
VKPDDKVMAGGYTGGRCAAWRPVSFATCNCHFKFLPNVLGLLSKPLGNFIREPLPDFYFISLQLLLGFSLNFTFRVTGSRAVRNAVGKYAGKRVTWSCGRTFSGNSSC